MDGKLQETPERPQRYIFIDTETTGLDPAIHDIIEVAAIVMEEDEDNVPQEIARYHGKWGITDGVVDLEALRINGRRTTDDVFSALDKRELVNGLADFLITYVTDKTFVVGAHIAFDVAFIEALFAKYGMVTTRLLSWYKQVDVQHIARFLHDAAVIEVPNFSMATLVWHVLGVNQWPHNAMQDVILTKDLYFAMRDMV